MNWFWSATPLTTVLLVFLSALGMYLSIIILTRITGLRSFAKVSAFDFATTIAIGALIGGTIVAPEPPLLQAVVATGSLLGLQALFASLRRRSSLLHRWIDNRPRLTSPRPCWKVSLIPNGSSAKMRSAAGDKLMTHPWHGIPVGDDFPKVFRMMVEIRRKETTKYELDPEPGFLEVNRIMHPPAPTPGTTSSTSAGIPATRSCAAC